MSHRKGRIEHHGNKKGSEEGSQETSEEGSQEEVSSRNRQHRRGTRKAFPFVFAGYDRE
jgi:hypothetical protein